MPSDNMTPQPSEIRKHYYLDHYVIIAPKRALRPHSFTTEPAVPDNAACVFCDNREKALLTLPVRGPWQVKVVANAFPALSLDNPKAYGAQEVIIDTADHELRFSDLPPDDIELLFEAYKRRLDKLKSNPGIRYVFLFKNNGALAGASVAHAHSQIIALPLVPPQIKLEHTALAAYRMEHGTCAHCEVIEWELSQKVRVVFDDKHMVAIAPYASDLHFEAWLIPKRHVGTLGDLTAAELHSMAVVLKKLTAKLDSVAMSFNYYLQETTDGEDHHFYLRLQPRSLKQKMAGADLGTGVIINPVAPEYAALWYQNKA